MRKWPDGGTKELIIYKFVGWPVELRVGRTKEGWVLTLFGRTKEGRTRLRKGCHVLVLADPTALSQ